MSNPFRKLSERDKAAKDIGPQEVEAEIRKLAELGRSMLADERYKEFEATFENIAEKQINLLINYEGQDKLMVTRLQERLKVFKLLIDLPLKAVKQQKALRDA